MKSMIWFLLLSELISLLEPDSIRVPIQKILDACNFKVYICPCGFYCMYENNLVAHLRFYHALAKEIIKKYTRG